jgi:hypothetical protein
MALPDATLMTDPPMEPVATMTSRGLTLTRTYLVGADNERDALTKAGIPQYGDLLASGSSLSVTSLNAKVFTGVHVEGVSQQTYSVEVVYAVAESQPQGSFVRPEIVPYAGLAFTNIVASNDPVAVRYSARPELGGDELEPLPAGETVYRDNGRVAFVVTWYTERSSFETDSIVALRSILNTINSNSVVLPRWFDQTAGAGPEFAAGTLRLLSEFQVEPIDVPTSTVPTKLIKWTLNLLYAVDHRVVWLVRDKDDKIVLTGGVPTIKQLSIYPWASWPVDELWD